jgi:hypothetical protein
MSTNAQNKTKQGEQDHKRTQDTRDALHAVIAEQVVHGLGSAAPPHRVQVRSLWGDFFRVNVLVGADAASLKVANSYFLKTDSEGRIVESTPKMVRQT